MMKEVLQREIVRVRGLLTAYVAIPAYQSCIAFRAIA
jgi:hypothetical protein